LVGKPARPTFAAIGFALVPVLVLILGWGPARAGDPCRIVLTPEPYAYHIYPNHHAVCPDGTPSRCYHYHWDWICEKGGKLYWDRRLEAAAHAACGCPMPEGVAPASPHVSPKTPDELIGPDK
jgi:hypothetical protein